VQIDILLCLISLSYSGTETYKEAVAFLQLRPTILSRVSENQCSEGTLNLDYKRTEAYKVVQ